MQKSKGNGEYGPEVTGDTAPESTELMRVAFDRSLVVDGMHPLKLLAVDELGAHFSDLEGRAWYFDAGRKEFRAMEPMDIHPARFQSTEQRPLAKAEKKIFTSMITAACYALRVHLQKKKELYEWGLQRAKESHEEGGDEDREALENAVHHIEGILPVLDRITQTGESKQAGLLKELGGKLDAYDKEQEI